MFAFRFMHRPTKIFESEVARWLSPGGAIESLCGNQRVRSGVILPQSVADVQCILYAASKAGGAVKLQAISCGRNWGFGSALPTRNGAYTLDLSALRSIRSLDLRSHCAELEPGVTQGQLDDALRRQGSTHYFNVTGAGLGASVIGNALERGIGYSGQRHLDLLDLEVVLPTGKIGRTSRFQALALNSAYLGGLGPDPTGLFCQSNFGVITSATIALHRRPEVMGAVMCRMTDADCFPDLITAISDLMSEGACYGVPHIFNRERIVTTLSPHLDHARAAELRSSAASWTALIPIQGSKGVFAAQAQHLETLLKPLGQIQVIGDVEDADLRLSNLVQGRPSDLALASVAYSVFGNSSAINAPVEATGAGLIHVTPVVAFCAQSVAEVEKLTFKTLRRHGYKAIPLSLNALSARTAALIVSIGFDRRSSQKTKAAHCAAHDLLETYVRAGLAPYRLGLGQGDRLPQMNAPWPEIFCAMQRILDPSGCMAPSRYEPLWRKNLPIDFINNPKEAELCIR
jgi:4-cresol dehydrogenase (hydroxylating) flavoprotein subunit